MYMQREIINTATDLYTRYGVKIITMDEISAVCGISKKTIYTHFENKIDLVDQVVVNLLDNIKSTFNNLVNKSNDAIEEAMAFRVELEEHYRHVDYRMLEELKKYYHKIWNKLIEFRRQEGLDLILANLVRGQKEGLYHIEFDNQLTAEMRLAQLSYLHQNASRPDFHEMFRQTTLHFLMGICSPSGQVELRKYMNN